MEQKNWFIRTGDFFFKYRNLLFPTLLVSLFVITKPVHEYLGMAWLEEIKDIAAVLVVLAGLALRGAVIGYAYIKRGGLNKQVYADTLVTQGFFGACRNPLYVGNFIIYFGVLLMHGAPLVVLVGMLFFTFVYSAIVAAEEFFLRGKFGADYAAYCRDVPRWGFKCSRLRGATEGMEFSFKRVLAKDYSTITNALIALAGIELLEDVSSHPENHSPSLAVMLVVGIVLLMAAAAFVRTLKKQGVLNIS